MTAEAAQSSRRSDADGGATAPDPAGKYKLVKLVTIGRTTGLPHIVTTRYAAFDGSFFVLSGRARSDWVLNILASGTAKMRLGELVYSTAGSRSTTSERLRALETFAQRYGKTMTREWYGSARVCLKLTPNAPPTRRGNVKGEGDVASNLAEWKALGRDYYRGVAEAFDSASEEYDYTINGNFINRWIRTRSISELLGYTHPEDTLLEIGCGTGAEAMQISKHVKMIVATDISSSMIALLKLKTEARKLDPKITPVELGASEIAAAARYLPGGRVRIAYSFNGALNCEPLIAAFPAELAKVTEDNGYFICSIRNTLCISEALAHGAVLQFDRMAPRKRQPIMVSVGGIDIPSYYYPPMKFAGFFSPHFRLRRMIGLPAILPPAYLSDVYFRARKILSFAERMEKAVAGSFPFNRFGDQTLFVFQKSTRT